MNVPSLTDRPADALLPGHRKLLTDISAISDQVIADAFAHERSATASIAICIARWRRAEHDGGRAA